MRILSKFANCPACGILPTGLLEVPDIGWSYGCDDDACVVVVVVVGCCWLFRERVVVVVDVVST
jgi:hypothetical protein